MTNCPFAGRSALALALVALTLACAVGSAPEGDAHLPPDAVLFDVLYINYAWGFQCFGTFIDAAGRVHRYDCTTLGDSIRASVYQGREDVLLERRFRLNDTIICRLDSADLARARKLVKMAAKRPPLEARQTGMYDSGGDSFEAYLYDPKTGERREVPLCSGGDWANAPSTDEARRLSVWLSAVCGCKDTLSAYRLPWEPIRMKEVH